MTHTTPPEKAPEHKSWHVFIPSGLCLYCNWHCDDCPLDVATCKCKPSLKEKQVLADYRLKQENAGTTDSWLE